MIELENKVAIVTGAAHGIGRAIALQLAKQGADVVGADINLEQMDRVIHDIKALGRRGMAVKTDVCKSEEAKLMVNAALATFGKIDILVNNAGGSARERRSLFCESTEEVWDYVLGLNLKGVLNCTRAVINHMIERRRGKIVNVASCAGVTGTAELADYSAAKAGVIGFTMALAKEVASYGINVNCVSPGPTETRARGMMSPDRIKKDAQTTGLGRYGKPEEIAAMVVFLASDEANFVTGQNYAVCGLKNLGF